MDHPVLSARLTDPAISSGNFPALGLGDRAVDANKGQVDSRQYDMPIFKQPRLEQDVIHDYVQSGIGHRPNSPVKGAFELHSRRTQPKSDAVLMVDEVYSSGAAVQIGRQCAEKLVDPEKHIVINQLSLQGYSDAGLASRARAVQQDNFAELRAHWAGRCSGTNRHWLPPLTISRPSIAILRL